MPSQPSAEAITVLCKCGKKLKAPATAVGRKARCPQCGNVMTLTAAPPPPPGHASAAAPATRNAPPPPPQQKRSVPPPPPPVDDGGLGLDAMYELAEQSEQAVKQSPQSPRCPRCMNEMSIGAVLCTNCGFDVRAGKVVKAAAGAAPVAEEPKGLGRFFKSKKKPTKDKPIDMMAPQGSFLMGVAGSAIGATIGGAIWFFVAVATEYELYFIALVVGALAGAGMQLGQKGYSQLGGVTAAAITLIGMLAAKTAVVLVVLMPLLKDDSTADASEEGYNERVVEVLVDDEFKAKQIDPEDATEEQYESAEKTAIKKAKKMSKAEQDAVLKRADEAEERDELVGYLVEDVLKERKQDIESAEIAQITLAEKEAEKRVDAMTPAQRATELKRLREKAEAEDDAAADAAGDEDSGPSATAKTGMFILFLLLVFGWKSAIFMIGGLALAYKTAAGAVSD